ncbi:hypothetical protein D047_3956B, partial [Vibrio parahaemolyticus VPTS-2010_2]
GVNCPDITPVTIFIDTTFAATKLVSVNRFGVDQFWNNVVAKVMARRFQFRIFGQRFFEHIHIKDVDPH